MLLAHQSDSSALSKPNIRTLSLTTNPKRVECREALIRTPPHFPALRNIKTPNKHTHRLKRTPTHEQLFPSQANLQNKTPQVEWFTYWTGWYAAESFHFSLGGLTPLPQRVIKRQGTIHIASIAHFYVLHPAALYNAYPNIAGIKCLS